MSWNVEEDEEKAPCSERFCHQGQMLFLLYFPFLYRENTLWFRQLEKYATAKTELWLVVWQYVLC